MPIWFWVTLAVTFVLAAVAEPPKGAFFIPWPDLPWKYGRLNLN